jgi:hypothetical protein
MEAAHTEMGRHCENLQGKIENLERIFSASVQMGSSSNEFAGFAAGGDWGMLGTNVDVDKSANALML